ncbi:CheB methylesterase domain-containing protein [Pacificoceanicola onchidii]|uniref:CheB methylesterase domain-containing protein n=1 Tax=Pacificoceanicola onchidii TaxID=2562685 RepID=UPI0010A58F8A|nr:CheB methylesterase domain-containing protein [Pacificoceanicola onchidii]
MPVAKSTIVAISDRVQRNRLTGLVESLPDFKVIACTADLMNTYNAVEETLPEAVLISSNLAQLPEFEVMRGLFSALDVRWLVVNDRTGDLSCLNPIAAGAPKGSDLFAVDVGAQAQLIASQLRSLTRTDSSCVLEVMPESTRRNTSNSMSLLTDSASKPKRLVLIGSSTGGVDALISILSDFGADCPPTVVVQHTGAGFGNSLASLLNRQCAASVSLVTSPRPLSQGEILVGAGTKSHLVLEGGREVCAKLIDAPPVSGHLPSVDMLFRSASSLGVQVSAALLTGMGRDGAEGLKELKEAGAHTIAQDEATSVVFGMPRAAIELGAASSVLPLHRIGRALLNPETSRQRVSP